jgi:sugar-specific transcriptional regulator TrmB
VTYVLHRQEEETKGQLTSGDTVRYDKADLVVAITTSYERTSMDDAVTLMQQLGFSEYEARAYLALLQRNPLNGYELAKVSGLPRANIYAVLQKLEERGAVVRLEMPNGARYAPVSPNQLTQRIGNRFQEALGAAQRAGESGDTTGDRVCVEYSGLCSPA